MLWYNYDGKSQNHNYCTIGLPIDRNGIEGFITAGHCVDNTSGSGDDVYQPTEDLFGFNKVGDVTVDLFQANCDCAWVDQSSSDTNTSAVWSNTNSWTNIVAYIDRPQAGSYVYLHGATSNLAIGVVDDPTAIFTYAGINFDTVSTTSDISSGGDSGGAYTTLAQNAFLGTHEGALNNVRSYFIPWENIQAQLGL